MRLPGVRHGQAVQPGDAIRLCLKKIPTRHHVVRAFFFFFLSSFCSLVDRRTVKRQTWNAPNTVGRSCQDGRNGHGR